MLQSPFNEGGVLGSSHISAAYDEEPGPTNVRHRIRRALDQDRHRSHKIHAGQNDLQNVVSS